MTGRALAAMSSGCDHAEVHLPGTGAENDAASVAEALRTTLGEKVNAPGVRAIEAVLAMQLGSTSQADVLKRYKTSKDSFRRYRDLMAKLARFDERSFAGSAVAEPSVGQPTSRAMSAEAVSSRARPLLSPQWLAAHVPSVREVRVVSEFDLNEADQPCRRLEVDTIGPDGSQATFVALARWHTPEDGSQRAKRACQTANWNAEERSMRALDSEAAVEHLQRERERKAAKRYADALVLYEQGATQPAVQPPAGDQAWQLPSEQRPRFAGETVWVCCPQQLHKPQLGIVVAVWQNGCCDIQLLISAAAAPVTAMVPVASVAIASVGTNATPITLVSPSVTLVSGIPTAADGTVSAHGSQLVPVGDELLPYSGSWTGRLTNPQLGYRGEMGVITTPYRYPRNVGLAITETAFPDGSRTVVLFNAHSMAFDGPTLNIPAPLEDLGPELQLFESISDQEAIWKMNLAAATCALQRHHRDELRRLHPLTAADRKPLPCSCNPYCTAHSLSINGAACLWCAGPLQAAEHSVQNGWRNSDETKFCDLCPFGRAEIPPGVRRLDCYKSNATLMCVRPAHVPLP